ncbi:MAG: hypothetical protein JNM20_17610 [Rhizobiales bacterium]|nr:hypothetical protein [Hyphomicrobiales bacterium]
MSKSAKPGRAKSEGASRRKFLRAGALFLVGLNYAVQPPTTAHVWTAANYPFF